MTVDSPLTDQLVERLDTRPVREDLEPVQNVVESHYSEPSWQTVQVVGTNGKGSLVHYATELMAGLDRTVVSYTSPHFFHPAERIAVNNHSISPAELEALLAEQSETHDGEFTPFESLFLAALRVAERESPDVLLLEAGMGGRWDATSSLPADWTLLTGVEREHTQFLGETRPEILREKLAQIPPRSHLVAPVMEGACGEVLRDFERTRQLRLTRLEGDDGDDFTRRLAVEYVHRVTGRPRDVLRDRLDGVKPPAGRRDVRTRNNRTVVLDVAHTPRAVSSLIGFLRTLPVQNWSAVYGSLRGKQVDAIVDALIDLAGPDRLVLTRPPSPRSLSLDELRERLSPDLDPSGYDEAIKAARRALERTKPNEGLLVVGSFTLVGRIMTAWWEP